MDPVISALIPHAEGKVQAKIAEVLGNFSDAILRRVAEAKTIVRPLKKGERYAEASLALRRLGIDVDAWPAPPAGLFVVEERTVYLRSCSPMTVAHEFGHAIDCALGGGVYVSVTDPKIRSAFLKARRFVTPYAASGIDEYFAEAVRAYGEVNDASSHWPKATRTRLKGVDPTMYGIVESLIGCAT